MTNTPAGILKPLESRLLQRPEFSDFVNDLSGAILFALERRHLEYLDLNTVDTHTRVEEPDPRDLFYLKVERLGHSVDQERSLDVLNLQNILGSFRDGSHNIISALCGDDRHTELYFGARQVPHERSNNLSTYQFVENMERAFKGNLPGTRFHRDSDTGETCFSPTREPGATSDMGECIRLAIDNYPHLAAITGIPSLRADRKDQFTQGLDRLTQALQGQRYTLLIIAEPIDEALLNDTLMRALQLNSEVHSLVRVGTSWAQAIGTAVAKGRTEGTIHNEAEALNLAETTGQGMTRSPGSAIGGLIGASLSLALSPLLGPASIAVGGLGSVLSAGLIGAKNVNRGETRSTSRTKTWGHTLTDALTRTASQTDTASMNVEYLNKAAEYCNRVIEGYVHRLQQGKNLGMWNIGVYFLAQESSTFAQGCSQLRALYAGQNTHFEPIRIVNLTGERIRQDMGQILATFSNPVLDLRTTENGQALNHPLGPTYTGLSSLLNTEEYAMLLNLPREEAPGLKLDMVAAFGVNPPHVDTPDAIAIGNVISVGTQLPNPGLCFAARDLTRHLFLTGMTGGGKTNTSLTLLLELHRQGVPFLVIEPAKGDYRRLLEQIPDLQIFTPGNSRLAPLSINPFQFVPGMNLVTHLDYLKSIFNASFPMYAAMPYLLEEALVEVYRDKGWDLENSEHPKLDMERIAQSWQTDAPDNSYTDYLPNLDDLLEKIGQVVRGKRYAEEVTMNYIAALRARINSLKLGSKGGMLNARGGMPLQYLFERPTVLELRSLGDDDEKCFLMALLLTLLYEYREQVQPKEDGLLRHVTVFEEAHRLLGNSGSGGSLETANPRGKAVETFANMLAEIREYGEGVIIIDQVPSKLVSDVLKNTSTKVVHRLAGRDDCDAMGDAMGMTVNQRQLVMRLRVGEAIVHTQQQDKPIWIGIPPLKDDLPRVSDATVREQMLPHLLVWNVSILSQRMKHLARRLESVPQPE